MNQVELARTVKTTANAVSRWETATYKPSVSDLENLAQFFGVPITAFFPQTDPNSRTNALLRATVDLDDEDLEEVTLYVLFRRTRLRKKGEEMKSPRAGKLFWVRGTCARLHE
ncbi:MAG: helix-turn-helix transcriptional regulator [Terriglobia bacterium]